MTKAKSKVPRKLFLKFRIVPHVRIPRSVVWRRIEEMVATGVVPEEFDIQYVDYSHKTGKVWQAGRELSLEELEDFRNLLGILAGMDRNGDVRVERVEQ